jgi:small-conductance mechanosensitive channel
MSFEIWQHKFLNNQLSDYLIAFGTLAGGMVGIKIIQSIIIHRLKSWARRTASTVDDSLLQLTERGLIPVLYLGTFYIAISNLSLDPVLRQAIDALLLMGGTVLAVRVLISISESFLRFYWRSQSRADNNNLQQMTKALLPAIRTAAWALGIVFVLDNLGFDVSAVLTGLGIGGVALALASQGVLEDLFCYFAILLDRPFELDDFIVVGEIKGAVDQVGIKTTRIKSLSGEQIVISNKDLTSSRIHNFKRMDRRRVVFNFGVTYQTTSEQLKEIPGIVQRIIESFQKTTFDRAHFSEYKDSSLHFEVVYYVYSNDYNLYMDIQQDINLKLKQELENRGIEFAYPTQVTYVNGAGGDLPPSENNLQPVSI